MTPAGLLADLYDCFRCGAAQWEPRLNAKGQPYLRCGGCGCATSMPRWLEEDLPLRRLPRDAALPSFRSDNRR